jgi:SCY1-like protein 2
MLPVLDFSTIKNELFPVVAAIFSKTNSLAIKVRGLQAFVILCGGSSDLSDDGLNGLTQNKKSSSSTALDKYTMQEKIMPLIKAIKTKEPAVMIAALNVCRVVGKAADADFVAMDILPALWNMSLGPLLNLEQFRQFMDLVKSLSARVEDEQTRKLQELGQSNGSSMPNEDFMSFGTLAGSTLDTNGATEDDFERLVKGKTTTSTSSSNPMDSWDSMPSSQTVTSPAMRSAVASPAAPAFAWSTPSPTTTTAKPPAASQFTAVKAQQPGFRTVTPDLGQFAALTPSATQFSQPLQPSTPAYQSTTGPSLNQPSSTGSSLNWGTASNSNPWASPPAANTVGTGLSTPMSSMSISLDQRPGIGHNRASSSSFSLPPPPATSASSGLGSSGFSLKPPPGSGVSSFSQQPIMPTTTNAFARPANTSASMGGMMNGMNAGNSMMNSTMGGMNGSIGSMNSMMGMAQRQQQQQQQPPAQPQQQQKSGLDKYASLL